MKFLFLLGPYRPGHCGVSDYVGLLAEKLEELGHGCRLVSIDPEKGSSLDSVARSLPPADIVSMQFAPYAFHPKGLPGRPLLQLAEALAEHALRVTFHEIWIGAYPRASWRERLMGKRQRKAVLHFLRTARPQAIYTTNAASLDRLQQADLHPEYLYLFGNVPYATPTTSSSNTEASSRQHDPFVAFFGTPYEDFPYRQLFENLADAFPMKDTPRIRILGGIRKDSGLALLREEAKRKELTVEETGRLSTEELSRELQGASCGVATTPYDALGKSGAAAAMLEHGLPIIAHDDGDTPEETLFAPGPFKERIILLDDTDFSSRFRELLEAPNSEFFDGVAHTAETFLRSLSSPA